MKQKKKTPPNMPFDKEVYCPYCWAEGEIGILETKDWGDWKVKVCQKCHTDTRIK